MQQGLLIVNRALQLLVQQMRMRMFVTRCVMPSATEYFKVISGPVTFTEGIESILFTP